MSDLDAPPITRATLRQFAFLTCAVLGGAFGLDLVRHGSPTRQGLAAACLAVLIGVPGMARPELLRPIFVGALWVTRPIGHLTSVVLLALVFFGVVTPLGLAFRLAGRDPLRLRRSAAQSLWTRLSTPQDPRVYLRPYQAQTADDSTASMSPSDVHPHASLSRSEPPAPGRGA